MIEAEPVRNAARGVPSGKLYVVVRDDLHPGLQMAQACHAVVSFSAVNREAFGEWGNRTIVIVRVSGEQRLAEMRAHAIRLDIPNGKFYEPDLDDELTAIALAPSIETDALCSGLDLALSYAVPVVRFLPPDPDDE